MSRIERHALHLVAFATAFAAAGMFSLLHGESAVAPAPAAPPETAPSADAQLRPVEHAFLSEGLSVARLQAEIARLGVSQARSSAVRELAQQLGADYAGITALLETLARRKSVDVPLQPVSYSDAYRELAQNSTTFDAAFIRAITQANQATLRLCEAAVANAKDPEIRETAGSLLPVIRDHVNKSSTLANNL